MMKGMGRSFRGFTLLELLIVILLLGIASATVMASMPSSTTQKLRTDTQQLASLLEKYRDHAIARDEVQVMVFKGNALFVEDNLSKQSSSVWSSDAVEVPELLSMRLGPEPVGEPIRFTITSRLDPSQRLTIGTDGVRAFAILKSHDE